MMSNNENVLQIKNLTVHYVVDKVTYEAVNDISLTLEKGKSLGLVGETGAGKTTTALAILNLVPSPPGVIVNGEIDVCGKNMLSLSNKELEKVRGYQVSMIFQDPMTSLNPVMTVGQQISEVIKYHEKLSPNEVREKACAMLETVGIPRDRINEYPHQFSGGMKQRVVIAMALASNPQLLLADEPTTALDVTIQAQVLELMRDLQKKMGTSLVMISHDLGIIADICDTVAVMYAGRIIEYGTLEEIFNHTRHPYTEGLFGSLPNINDRKQELKPIKGLMPDPTNLPEGCAFAPRCPYAVPACSKALPDRIYFTETHSVLCSRYNEEGFHIERRIES